MKNRFTIHLTYSMNEDRRLQKSRYTCPAGWFLIPLALVVTSCGAPVNLDGVRELGKQAAVAQQSLPALAADIKGSCLRSARFKIDQGESLSGQLSAITNLVDVALQRPTGVSGENILRSLDRIPAEQLNTERIRELLTRLPDDDSQFPYKARVDKIRACNATYGDELPTRLKQTHDVLLNYLVALGKLASDDQVKFDDEVKQLADAVQGITGPLAITVQDDQIAAGQQILTFLLRMFTEEKRRGVLFDELKKTGPAVVAYTPFLVETLDAYERQLILERESINIFYMTTIKWQTDLKTESNTQSEPLPSSMVLIDRQWGQDKQKVEERLVAAIAYRRILQLIQVQASVFVQDPNAETITLESLNGKANQLALDIKPLLIKMQVLDK